MRSYHKYRAIPTTIDNIRFASKKEARRYAELKLLVAAKEVKDLELQPRFPCVIDGQLVTTYVADFRYIDCRTGRVVIEDSKGVRTPEFKIKKKLVKALLGVDVLES